MLTLSTGHVTHKTMRMLEQEPEKNNMQLTVYPKGQDFEFGCFIYLPDPKLTSHHIPDDLRACLNLCIKENCKVLCLDPDAEPIDGLTFYAW